MFRSFWTAFTLLLLVTSHSVSALADKRVALVIGNGAYKNVARLDNPPNDAKLMADTLKGLGFALIGGGAQINLDKPGVDRAVQAFGAQLQGADVGLFYYAGHGVQVRGANYLVPVDANPTKEADVDFQMLDTNLVLRQMDSAGAKLNLVILDACRNNPFGGRGLRATGGGLAQIQAPQGTLISFATQPGNVAQDGSDGDSPYTKALAQTLRRPGLDIFQTFNEVGLAVQQATGNSQQPWLSSSPISGTFYFTAPPAAANSSGSTLPADDIFWLAISDSTVPALFDEFLRKFPKSPHATEAHARLDVFKKSQIAAVLPPLPPPPVPPIHQQTALPPPASAPPPAPSAPSSTKGFIVRKALAVRSATELNDATVCVQNDPTTIRHLVDYFAANKMKLTHVDFATFDEALRAYGTSRCDAITADLATLRAAQPTQSKPADHLILPE